MKRTTASVPNHIRDESELRLNEVVFFLRQQKDMELNRWFVQTLADETFVNTVALPDDEIDQADLLADTWVTTILLHGERNPSGRAELCRHAIRKLADLTEAVQSWSKDDYLWEQWDRQARDRFHE